jgi:hypothetical protein
MLLPVGITAWQICHLYDVFDEEDYYYDTEGDVHSYDEWWSIIKNEVDHNGAVTVY